MRPPPSLAPTMAPAMRFGWIVASNDPHGPLKLTVLLAGFNWLYKRDKPNIPFTGRVNGFGRCSTGLSTFRGFSRLTSFDHLKRTPKGSQVSLGVPYFEKVPFGTVSRWPGFCLQMPHSTELQLSARVRQSLELRNVGSRKLAFANGGIFQSNVHIVGPSLLCSPGWNSGTSKVSGGTWTC